jgi:hypothetical protein
MVRCKENPMFEKMLTHIWWTLVGVSKFEKRGRKGDVWGALKAPGWSDGVLQRAPDKAPRVGVSRLC